MTRIVRAGTRHVELSYDVSIDSLVESDLGDVIAAISNDIDKGITASDVIHIESGKEIGWNILC